MEGLEAFTFAIFTRALGMSKEECEVVCAKIRSEIKDPKMHAFFHMYVILSATSYPLPMRLRWRLNTSFHFSFSETTYCFICD